jgi:hypothetical protein
LGEKWGKPILATVLVSHSILKSSLHKNQKKSISYGGISMVVEVSINGWDKYNRRSGGIKNPIWFSFTNRFFEDPDVWSLDSEEKVSFIYLLCQRSQRGRDPIAVEKSHFEKFTDIKFNKLLVAIEKLEQKQIVTTSRSQPDRDPIAARSLQDKTIHNRTEHNRTSTIVDCADVRSLPAPQHIRQFPDLEFFWLIKEIKDELVNAWIAAYDKEWLASEIQKAKVWCLANPKKKPKAPGPFLSNWFSRGWERHRKTLQTNYAVNQIDYSKLE